eukprot:14765890-Alexandrium_andersonii.AAC.1
MPNRLTCPTPRLTPGSPKRSFARCSLHDAVTGCSRQKRAPRSSWAGVASPRTPSAREPCATSRPPPPDTYA